MKKTMDLRITKAIEEAVFEAIEKVGFAKFKQTSLFLSNERSASQDKIAA